MQHAAAEAHQAHNQPVDRAEKQRAIQNIQKIILMDDEFSEHAENFTSTEEPDLSNAGLGEAAPEDAIDRE